MRMERIRPVDAGTLLLRTLRHEAAAAGCAIAIESLAVRPWSSATFVGARHRVVMQAESGPALDAWLAALPEAELAVRGHLVADLVVERDDAATVPRRIVLTVLTLIDG